MTSERVQKLTLIEDTEEQELRGSFAKSVKHNIPMQGSYIHNRGAEPLLYKTLGEVLDHTASIWPDRVAIHSVHEDRSLTFKQLLLQAKDFSGFLRLKGFKKGDRLGIWCHNNADWIVALVGAAKIGVITVAISSAYEIPELKLCIKKTKPKGLLIGDGAINKDYYGQLCQMIPELNNAEPGSLESEEFSTLTTIIVAGNEDLRGTFSFKSAISQFKESGRSQYGSEPSPDDGCIIHLTSGSTGEPKAALSTHFAVVNNALCTGKRLECDKTRHRLCVQVPIFHAFGSIVTVLGPLLCGSMVVLAAPIYNMPANIKALYEKKCTMITGTPTMFVDLVNHVKSSGAPPADLRVAVTAGATCSLQLLQEIKQYLKAEVVINLFGMTETTGALFQCRFGDSEELITETVGYVMDHVEMKVVDNQGRLVPFDSPGELMVRSYKNMKLYWDEPGKTKETIDDDGWLRTGDQFTLSKDGYGRVTGRFKTLIVRGGEKIAPSEIENLLDSNPDIIESQVIGLPDERLGEEICAIVRLRENVKMVPRDIKEYCNGRISKFKIPRILVTIDSFPRTDSGKIDQKKLKIDIESGKLERLYL